MLHKFVVFSFLVSAYADENVLLQQSAGSRLSSQKFQETISSLREEAARIKNGVLSMAADALLTSLTPQENDDEIQKIIVLCNQLLQTMIDGKSTREGQIADIFQDVTDCAAPFNDNINVATQHRDDTKEIHRVCRDGQFDLRKEFATGDCYSLEDNLVARMISLRTSLCGVRTHLEIPTLEVLEASASGTLNFAAWTDLFNNAAQVFNLWGEAHTNFNAGCQSDMELYAQQNVACQADQQSFELAVCALHARVNSECNRQDDCYSNVNDSYNLLLSSNTSWNDENTLSYAVVLYIRCAIQTLLTVPPHTIEECTTNYSGPFREEASGIMTVDMDPLSPQVYCDRDHAGVLPTSFASFTDAYYKEMNRNDSTTFDLTLQSLHREDPNPAIEAYHANATTTDFHWLVDHTGVYDDSNCGP